MGNENKDGRLGEQTHFFFFFLGRKPVLSIS